MSVLGSDVKVKSVLVNKGSSAIRPGRDMECGFVVKLSNGSGFFEYSLDDIEEDAAALSEKIREAFALQQQLHPETVQNTLLPDEPLKQSFCRKSDLQYFGDRDML